MGCFLNQLRPCGRYVFFFIAFINNSKIITGKQLAVILIFIHRSSFFLWNYKIFGWCSWGKGLCCALLSSWPVSSFLCRSDIIKSSVMKETGQLFLSMSHSAALRVRGHANPALCFPQHVSIIKWQDITMFKFTLLSCSNCGQVQRPCQYVSLHLPTY